MPNYIPKRSLSVNGKHQGHPFNPRSAYSEEVVEKVCNHVANGGSLRALMREDKTIPSYYVLFGWMQEHPEFEDKWRTARAFNADALFDEILEISNTPVDTIMTVQRAKGNVETTKKDAVEHRRLQIESRKWMIEKLAPRKYGNKITTEISGPDGSPLQISNISDELRVKALADFIAKTKGLPPPEEK